MSYAPWPRGRKLSARAESDRLGKQISGFGHRHIEPQSGAKLVLSSIRQFRLLFVVLLLFRKCLDFFCYPLMPLLAFSMSVSLNLGFWSSLVLTIQFF